MKLMNSALLGLAIALSSTAVGATGIVPANATASALSTTSGYSAGDITI